jgi:hypothetical protein
MKWIWMADTLLRRSWLRLGSGLNLGMSIRSDSLLVSVCFIDNGCSVFYLKQSHCSGFSKRTLSLPRAWSSNKLWIS